MTVAVRRIGTRGRLARRCHAAATRSTAPGGAHRPPASRPARPDRRGRPLGARRGQLAAITLLLVYVYGMVGWVIFHDHDPANFGNVGQSMVTMFVLLTLENLPSYIESGQRLSDWTLLFYVSYVLLASFLIFNLFIGIVINSMQEARALELRRAELEQARAPDDERAHAVILEERLRALRSALADLEREVRAKRH